MQKKPSSTRTRRRRLESKRSNSTHTPPLPCLSAKRRCPIRRVLQKSFRRMPPPPPCSRQGKGKGKNGYPVRPSHLSVQDRRAELAGLKQRIECKPCGRRGHWSVDPVCPVKKGGASISGSGTRTAHSRPAGSSASRVKTARIKSLLLS